MSQGLTLQQRYLKRPSTRLEFVQVFSGESWLEHLGFWCLCEHLLCSCWPRSGASSSGHDATPVDSVEDAHVAAAKEWVQKNFPSPIREPAPADQFLDYIQNLTGQDVTRLRSSNRFIMSLTRAFIRFRFETPEQMAKAYGIYVLANEEWVRLAKENALDDVMVLKHAKNLAADTKVLISSLTDIKHTEPARMATLMRAVADVNELQRRTLNLVKTEHLHLHRILSGWHHCSILT